MSAATADASTTLRDLDDQVARSLAELGRMATNHCHPSLVALSTVVDERRRQSGTVDLAWLQRQPEYVSVTHCLAGAWNVYGALAVSTIVAGITMASARARLVAAAQLGQTVMVSAPVRAVDPAGVPLVDRLREHGLRLARQTVDVLLSPSVAGSTRPLLDAVLPERVVATLALARASIVSTFRAGLLSAYRSSDSARGWVWIAALDRRTCPICWAKHGSIHPVDAPFYSHVLCRCVAQPLRRGESAPLTGPEEFARLSADDRLAILGPGKYDLYQAGRITLADLVEETTHPEYGPTLRERPLRVLASR